MRGAWGLGFSNDSKWLALIHCFSRNSAVFYSKSANLIGFPTVVYSLIDNSRARVAIYFLIFVLKVHNLVGFGLQSFRVPTNTIRLLALVFFER